MGIDVKYSNIEIEINIESIIKQAGEIGATEAKKLAPVGRRGKYKEQIKTVYDPNSKQAVVFVDGSEASLSHLLEDGHRVGKRKKKYTKPQPHFRPAFNRVKSYYFEAMKKATFILKKNEKKG